jgi:hypothetical protein
MGSDQGAQWRWWQPRVVVVVGGDDGGKREGGMITTCDVGDVSTTVARFGNSQAPIINQG